MYRKRLSNCFHAIFIFSWGLFLPSAFAGPVLYTITDLHPAGDSGSSDAFAINDRGQILVGIGSESYRTAPRSPVNPASDSLGMFHGTNAFPVDINESGQVLGFGTGTDGSIRSFRTAPNAMINTATDELGSLGGTYTRAFAINDTGEVVGWSYDSNGIHQGFRTQPNAAINPTTDFIGMFPDAGTEIPTAINNAGQVSGHWQVSGPMWRAFRTTANSPIDPATDDLGSLDAITSLVEDMNEAGQVVGSLAYGGGVGRPFFFDGITMVALGTLGGDRAHARAINDLGQIVGISNLQAGSGNVQPFLYWSGSMINLNDLIDPLSGWTLEGVEDINNHGEIVGMGYNSISGERHAYLLTPIPEPSTLCLLVVGIGAIVSRSRAKGFRRSL